MRGLPATNNGNNRGRPTPRCGLGALRELVARKQRRNPMPQSPHARQGPFRPLAFFRCSTISHMPLEDERARGCSAPSSDWVARQGLGYRPSPPPSTPAERSGSPRTYRHGTPGPDTATSRVPHYCFRLAPGICATFLRARRHFRALLRSITNLAAFCPTITTSSMIARTRKLDDYIHVLSVFA